MPDEIVFERGKFQKFRATTRIHLGTQGRDIGENDIIEFDGQTVQYGGESFSLPIVKGGIKSGWFVPATDEDTRYVPKPSGLQVHPAQQAHGQQTAPMKMGMAVEDERVVGNVDARKEARTGIPTPRAPAPDPRKAPAPPPGRNLPVEREGEDRPVRPVHREASQQVPPPGGVAPQGAYPAPAGWPYPQAPQAQPPMRADLPPQYQQVPQQPPQVPQGYPPQGSYQSPYQQQYPQYPQPQVPIAPQIPRASVPPSQFNQPRQAYRATIAFHLGAASNLDRTDRNSLNDVTLELNEIVEFDGRTTWVRGEPFMFPMMAKAIKSGWLVPAEDWTTQYVPPPAGVEVKTLPTTTVVVGTAGHKVIESRALVGSEPGSDGDSVAEFGRMPKGKTAAEVAQRQPPQPQYPGYPPQAYPQPPYQQPPQYPQGQGYPQAPAYPPPGQPQQYPQQGGYPPGYQPPPQGYVPPQAPYQQPPQPLVGDTLEEVLPEAVSTGHTAAVQVEVPGFDGQSDQPVVNVEVPGFDGKNDEGEIEIELDPSAERVVPQRPALATRQDAAQAQRSANAQMPTQRDQPKEVPPGPGGMTWDMVNVSWRDRIKNAVEQHGQDMAVMQYILSIETQVVQRYIKSELTRRGLPCPN